MAIFDIVRAMMGETEAVAGSREITLRISIERRIAGAPEVGARKTSMLQDDQAGRPMELEAVVGAVVEPGGRPGVPMMATHAMSASARFLEDYRPGLAPRMGGGVL